MLWDTWRSRWELALAACMKKGGTVEPLVTEGPTSGDEIRHVEQKLGCSLPPALRAVLATFSKKVDFRWHLPTLEERRLLGMPEAVLGIFAGECRWDLSSLALIDAEPYDGDPFWQNKLAFLDVANGDNLAIDISSPDRSPVVYLSHENGPGHGYELGADFVDFMDRWSLLGCPGAEDWQWHIFTSSPQSYILPDCPNALVWRAWFGLP